MILFVAGRMVWQGVLDEDVGVLGVVRAYLWKPGWISIRVCRASSEQRVMPSSPDQRPA